MTCSRCNGTMYLEENRNRYRLICPFCGNSDKLLLDNDEVRIADLWANVARAQLEYKHCERNEYIQMEKKRQTAQIVVICALAVLILSLVLIWVLK